MSWHPTLTQLRDMLQNLYQTQESSYSVVDDAEIPRDHIAFQASSLQNWHNILQEAHKRDKVPALVDVVLQRYPERSNQLREAVRRYLAASGAVRVVVLPFAGSPPDLNQPVERIIYNLLLAHVAKSERHRLQLRVELMSSTEPSPASAADAQAIAVRYGAATVIWGRWDSLSLHVAIESPWLVPNLDRPAGSWPAAALSLATTIETGQPPSRKAAQDWSIQASYLASLALGIVCLHQGQLPQAEQLLDQAIAVGSAASRRGLSTHAAFCMRGIARALREQFPAALDDFSRALELNPDNMLARAQHGVAAAAIGYIDMALDDFKIALKQLDKNDLAGRAALLCNLGQLLDLQGDFDQALDHYQDALQQTGRLQDPVATMLCLIQLGSHFQRSHQYEQAKKHCDEALKLCRQHHFQAGEVQVLDTIGQLHAARGKSVAALDAFQQALAVAEALDSPISIARQLIQIGAFQLEESHEAAQVSFQRALNLFTSVGISSGQAQAYVGIALTEQQRGHLAGKIDALEHAYQLYEQIGSPDAEVVRRQLEQARLMLG
jgi:tetratricopeptide (TPR) repeat protein